MLDKLKRLEKNISVGIIGMGAMGKGLYYQCSITPGIECKAIADINIDRAVKCAEWLNKKFRVVENLRQMNEAIGRGYVAVCQDGILISQCELIEVLIEATNTINEGGLFSETSLMYNKHLVLMNAEVDLIFGPYLLDLAKKNSLVYTSCDGDQHGVIKHLIDDLKLWGFDLVTAGNIKGFLDRYSNPTKIIPEADKRNLDYKMATAYTDGTKLNVEMSLVANALGLSTLIPGMHGPEAKSVQEVFQLLDFNELYKGKPFVDYILGAEPGGGVFAIGYQDNEYQTSMLSYYKLGNGPFYLFYRPYHLCHIESMFCVADAYLNHKSLLQPDHGFQTNVYAYAKKNLKKGEVLDGIGGYLCYGMIENFPAMNEKKSLPICIAENVVLNRDVKKDEKIYMADVDFSSNQIGFDLYSKALDCSI